MHLSGLPSSIVQRPEYYKVYNLYQGKKRKKRTIQEPNSQLMGIQQKLVTFFERYPLLDCCMSRTGRGIKDNAAAHVKAKYVLRIDISHCYSSIRPTHVRDGIDLIGDRTWTYVANQLTRYCFYWQDSLQPGFLPTGAPTSPILCNIALTPLDIKVKKLANEYGYTYTRYIDDLHLSTTSNTRHWELIDKVSKLIEENHLKVNKEKSKWYTVNDNDKVIITGVRIKQGCTAPRDFARIVRARLQNLAKDKKPIDSETQGCLAYISSIDSQKYNSLLQYYNRRLNYEPVKGACISS
jgi:hypothetical protein